MSFGADASGEPLFTCIRSFQKRVYLAHYCTNGSNKFEPVQIEISSPLCNHVLSEFENLKRSPPNQSKLEHTLLYNMACLRNERQRLSSLSFVIGSVIRSKSDFRRLPGRDSTPGALPYHNSSSRVSPNLSLRRTFGNFCWADSGGFYNTKRDSELVYHFGWKKSTNQKSHSPPFI